MRYPLICLLAGLAPIATPLPAQSHAPGSVLGPGAPGAAMTGFGSALVIGDNEVLVGEPDNNFRPGLVYVYRKVGATWRPAVTLTSPDSQPSDRFGASLAISGPDLFVGELRGAGKIHVFRREGTSWKRTGTIEVPDAEPGDGFGASLAASGDWLLVSAAQQRVMIDSAAVRSGSVYAFRRGANGQYALVGKLPARDPKPNDLFGSSIAINESHALVGSIGKSQRTGAVQVYRVDSTGAWRESGQITRPNLRTTEMFGFTVRLRGDSAFIGHLFQDNGYGAVYVFRWNRERSQWSEQARFASGSARVSRFGMSIDTDGREVWVGAPTAGPEGRVYIFGADSVQAAPRVLTQAGTRGDQFGQLVAVKGDLAAVSATEADMGDGNVVIYQRDARGEWQRAARLTTTVDALPAITGGERRCDGQGKVALFSCKGADLRGFLPVTSLTTARTSHLSGVWGWTDATTNREYALVGRTDGVAFVEVTDPANPAFLGELPMTENTERNAWREIKTYKDHAFVISEGQGHGMQVFDLTQLRSIRRGARPTVFKESAHYDRVSSSHNVVINEESGFAYIVGAGGLGESCGGALHMVDIREPRAPKFAGCHADSTTGLRMNGYIHDAQCVTYRGPDQRYAGREVCVTANENAVNLVDVTDKARPRVIATGKYPSPGYAHQGWFTADQRYWFMNDELDEGPGKFERTRTIIWDMADLEKPVASEFFGTTGATDHNLYINGNLMYQSNYQAGLRIIDVTDPTKPVEVGYFDTAPYEENTAGFGGTWSNYPFFRSGTILVNSGNEGLFLIKKSEALTP